MSSLGIDTWGVDFGLLDSNGKLLGNPVNYRDARTEGMFEKVFEKVPKAEVFAQSGIQFMELNTLYQLMALSLSDSVEYKEADKMLFIPDLLNYWLTGEMKAERTFASTSQFYNPVTKDWAYDMLEKLGIRTDLFAELTDPGTVIGDMEGLPVVAVGSHDTASAFAAVPVADGEHSAFLSSGTWSLLGAELSEPVINDQALKANFTNEVGVCDTIRFLKNLSGFWILQELKRVWNEEGNDYSWPDMDVMAEAAKRMARLLIEDVTLTRFPEYARVQIRFRGGQARSLDVSHPPTAWQIRKTPPEMITEIVRLLDHYTESEIVQIFIQRGQKSAAGCEFNRRIIFKICNSHGLANRKDRLLAKGWKTAKELAKEHRVAQTTIRKCSDQFERRACGGERYLYKLKEDHHPEK